MQQFDSSVTDEFIFHLLQSDMDLAIANQIFAIFVYQDNFIGMLSASERIETWRNISGDFVQCPSGPNIIMSCYDGREMI